MQQPSNSKLIKCWRCAGSGVIRCFHCNGEGVFLKVEYGYTISTTTCTACGGSGIKYICNDCQGHGYKER